MLETDPLLNWLYSLKGPTLKWDLETAVAFLEALGRPDRRYPSVHIAGTNGKGSVAATLHQIALASGLRSGLFTSPHLVRPEERIRLGREDIDAVLFRSLIERLRPAAEAGTASGRLPRFPSFFEMLTAAAFLAFAEAGVELAVVECGLGGRLDATNLIRPRLAVVVTVGFDHVKTLGPRLADIAREKAGIIKPGVPVLIGWLPQRAREVLARRAEECGCLLHAAEDEVQVRTGKAGAWRVRTPEREYCNLVSPLAGPHQQRNTALALRAAELLRQEGVALDPPAFAEGVARVAWPGRMETIPGRPGYLLDGAHNQEGARALARHLKQVDRKEGPRRRVAVFGMTEGRRPDQLLRPWIEAVEMVFLTRPGIDKAVDPASIASALGDLAPRCRVAGDPAGALRQAAALAGPDGQVLVTGSLYLVGDARRILLGLKGPGHPPRETSLPPVGPEVDPR